MSNYEVRAWIITQGRFLVKHFGQRFFHAINSFAECLFLTQIEQRENEEGRLVHYNVEYI